MVSVELSHQSTGICQREKVAFDKTHIPHILGVLKSQVGSAFVLSTCNRFSIYSSATDPEAIIDFFESHGVEPSLISVTRGVEATVKKLFETASGLRSQFYGERQILSQVKEYYQLARATHSLDKELDLLVRSAIHAGKEVQKQTGLYRLGNSLADAVHKHISRHIQETKGERILIFGTGSIAKLILTKLTENRLREIYVVSQDEERLMMMKEKYNVKIISYNQFEKQAKWFDIFIGASDQKKDLSKCFSPTEQKGIQVIDLGVPRNFELEVKEKRGVEFMDLENLQSTIQGDVECSVEIKKAHCIVASEIDFFLIAFKRLTFSSFTGAYWRKVQQASEAEFQKLLPKLRHLDEAEHTQIKKYSHRLLRSLSRDVMEYMNTLARSEDGHQEAEVVRRLFKLEEETI